jgi:hypothetical protein
LRNLCNNIQNWRMILNNVDFIISWMLVFWDQSRKNQSFTLQLGTSTVHLLSCLNKMSSLGTSSFSPSICQSNCTSNLKQITYGIYYQFHPMKMHIPFIPEMCHTRVILFFIFCYWGSTYWIYMFFWSWRYNEFLEISIVWSYISTLGILGLTMKGGKIWT